MVNNSIYKCNYCGCLLRFRYQIGAFDSPVSAYCPKCNSHIFGYMHIDNANVGIKENLVGAKLVDTDIYEYVIELSTEFLVTKCREKNDTTDFQPSMFLKSNPFDENRNKRRNSLISFFVLLE